MSIRALINGLGEAKRPKRWYTLLPKIDEDGTKDAIPALEIEVSYVKEPEWRALMKPFQGNIMQALNDKPFQREFLRLAMATKKWRGFSKYNLLRFGDYFLEHPELLNLVPDELQFPEDAEEYEFLVNNMSDMLFTNLFNAAVSLDDMARAVIDEAKNAVGHS